MGLRARAVGYHSRHVERPSPPMTRASLRVGVLGAGTVGTEVIRGLLDRGDSLGAEGCRFEVTGIAVRDVDGARRRGLPDALLTDAPAHVVASPDTDVIVELMGGAEPAQTLIAAALSAGKPVVTANKQVIAHRGPELERISRRTGAALRLEAAVGGGIPVLRPLAEDLAANDVRRVRVVGTDVIESTARVAAGLAIRTCPLTLADLRSGLDPSAGDVPIYPI